MTQMYARGVEEFITRLQEEGVKVGKNRADKLLEDAHAQAAKIIDGALNDAEKIIEDAQNKSQIEIETGRNTLNLALRDLMLDFRGTVTRQFEEELGRLVTNVLENEKTIQSILMLLCKKSFDSIGDYDVKDLEVLVSSKYDDALKNSNLYSDINELIDGLAYRVIDKGLDFSGIKVAIKQKQVSVDFTDKALTEAIMHYVQPHFRDLLMGLNQ